MENNRYVITLTEVPAEVAEIRQEGVPMGLFQRRTEAGYLLEDGTALLETMKENGVTEYH